MVYNIFKEDCGCAYKLFTFYLQKNQIVHCYDMTFAAFMPSNLLLILDYFTQCCDHAEVFLTKWM